MTEPAWMPAIRRARYAVATVLRDELAEPTVPAAEFLPVASKAIDTWLQESNPVGHPETIYDEFYRLREALRKIRDYRGESAAVFATRMARAALEDLEVDGY